jgi:formate C-acetyltransferase
VPGAENHSPETLIRKDKAMNDRIARLRKRFVESERKVDIERAVLITESFQENEDKPPILAKAIALKTIFSKMRIEVREDELIVGNLAGERKAAPLFPEYAVGWILRSMDTFPIRQGDRFQITEDQKNTLRKVLPYWKGRCLRDKIKGALPEFLKEKLSYGVFGNENFTMSGPGHLVPDHERILASGLAAIGSECRQKFDSLDLSDPFYIGKAELYYACALICDAIIDWAGRYAEEAERLAGTEQEPVRQKELLRIAANCRRVPRHGARDFWEALQCVYFIQIAIQLEANGLSIAPGRPDQYLYPYYRKDLDGGVSRREELFELIQAFYLKLSETDKVYSNEATRYLQGPGHGQTFSLGGITPKGRDGVNELSHIFLEADRSVRLVQPDIAVRVHGTTPESFLRAAAVNIRDGLTKPKFMNDEVIIQSMLDIGIPLEDARDWGSLGCSEPVICGKTDSWGNAGQLNLAKCLELALNNGKCMLTGTQMGPATGNPAAFSTFDQVLNAFREQVRHFVRFLVLYDNIIDRFHAEIAPVPLLSVAVRGCLEKGLEFNRGGAIYNTTSPVGVGPITAGDSLAAVKKLVFDEKALTMETLKDALLKNFEGYENVRMMLINRAPKFGNDEDAVDNLCNEVSAVFCDELRKYRNPRGGPFIGALYYLTANIPFGHRTAATPDGRKAGEPLNDGGISPVHGRDRRGATAVAKSAGKLDQQRIPHGTILNQRFHPTVLEGEDKLRLFTQYIRTFMNLGGWHNQMNVVTSEILRAAQENPDRHRDLVIRVAGYSAYFTQLEKEVQDDIIARTEHSAF